jgi:hypothetical protein
VLSCAVIASDEPAPIRLVIPHPHIDQAIFILIMGGEAERVGIAAVMGTRPRAAGALAKGAVLVGNHHRPRGFVDQACELPLASARGR